MRQRVVTFVKGSLFGPEIYLSFMSDFPLSPTVNSALYDDGPTLYTSCRSDRHFQGAVDLVVVKIASEHE